MISAQDIAVQEHKKLEVRKATYRVILEQLCRKIKNASNLGERSIFLQVPPFVVGYPVYDIGKATEYTQRQLTRLGYKVIKVSHGTLGITWGEKPKNATVIIDHGELPSLANLQKTAAKLKKGK